MTNKNNNNFNNIVAKALQKLGSNKHIFIDKTNKQLTFISLFIFYLFMILLFNQFNLIFNIYFSSIFIFIIIFVILMFIIDNYNYSTNFFIRSIQKITIIIISFYTILSIFINYILYYLIPIITTINQKVFNNNNNNHGVDINNNKKINFNNIINSTMDNTISKDEIIQKSEVLNTVQKDDVIVTSQAIINSIENVGTSIGEGLKSLGNTGLIEVATSIGGTLGLAMGAAKVTTAVIKGMSSASIGQKSLATLATTAAFTTGVVGTMGVIKGVNNNFNSNKNFTNNNNLNFNKNVNENIEISEIPKEDFIPSLLDPSELANVTTPLEELLNGQILFSSLILISLLIIIYSLIMLFISKYNINLLSFIIGDKWANKIIKVETIININNKFYSIIIVVNILLLVYFVSMIIFISTELKMNLNDYINVHKSIKDSFGAFIAIGNLSNKIQNNTYLCKYNQYHHNYPQIGYWGKTYNYINTLIYNNLNYQRVNCYSTIPNKDYQYKTLQNINITPYSKYITKFNDIKGNNISLKMGDIQKYKFNPQLKLKENIINFVNLLNDGYVYSMGLNIFINNYGYKTLGEHILITKKINIKSLSIYIEGLLLMGELNYGEEFNDLLEDNNYFASSLNNSKFIEIKYKLISIVKKDYNSISDNNKLKKRLYEIEQRMSYDNIGSDDNNNSPIFNSLLNKKLINRLNILHITMDVKTFGLLINKNFVWNKCKGELYKFNHELEIFLYDKNEKSQQVLVLKKGVEYIQFTDFNINEKEFKRVIFNNQLFYKNSELVKIEKLVNCAMITNSDRSLIRDTKFLTFDIECYLENDNFIPYSCAYYKKTVNNKTFKPIIDSNILYLSNFESWEQMLLELYLELFNKFDKHTIYVHNLGGFDSFFMIKTACKVGKVKTLFKDNKLISFEICRTITVDNKLVKTYLYFKDSLKLLPFSLKKLIKQFNIQTDKLIFPYYFPNKNNLKYEGCLPDYKFYNNTDISLDDYNKLSFEFNNKIWNLEQECDKYIYNDVKALFEVLDEFSKVQFEKEKINITSVISISSLALKTFLANYYPKPTVPNEIKVEDKVDNKTIKGKLTYKPKTLLNPNTENRLLIPNYEDYVNLRKSYFGGRVEVFKPFGNNIYIYDVNSLFPYVMKNDMPGGNMYLSSDTDLDNYFGICYAEINVPNNIYNPILTVKNNKGNNFNPTGNWKGWYTSEILKKARTLNIEVKVLYGYKFDRLKNIFNDYVDNFYNLKNEAKVNQNNTLYQMSKLMLNSLYGRMGLKYDNSSMEIVDNDRAINIYKLFRVIESHKLDENCELIKYLNVKAANSLDVEVSDNMKSNSNKIEKTIRSIQIASFVTSYANIYMHDFLNIPDNKCYYTDTDSLFLEKPLDPKFVGDNIGQFKFEGIATEAYFISPKTYCLKMLNGDTIIKTKGFNNEHLKIEDFKNLLNGKNLLINTYKFNTNWTNLSVKYVPTSLNIKPNLLKRKLIKNLPNNTIPFDYNELFNN